MRDVRRIQRKRSWLASRPRSKRVSQLAQYFHSPLGKSSKIGDKCCLKYQQGRIALCAIKPASPPICLGTILLLITTKQHVTLYFYIWMTIRMLQRMFSRHWHSLCNCKFLSRKYPLDGFNVCPDLSIVAWVIDTLVSHFQTIEQTSSAPAFPMVRSKSLCYVSSQIRKGGLPLFRPRQQVAVRMQTLSSQIWLSTCIDLVFSTLEDLRSAFPAEGDDQSLFALVEHILSANANKFLSASGRSFPYAPEFVDT